MKQFEEDRKKRNVGTDIDEPKAVVELDAVQDSDLSLIVQIDVLEA